MEEVLEGIRELFLCLLPVAGVVALVYLAFFLKKLIETLKEFDKTLAVVDTQIKKLDAPLATVEDLSHTVDDVHHAAREATIAAVKSAGEGLDQLKAWVNEKKEDQKLAKDAEAVKSWVDEKTTVVKEKQDEIKDAVHQKRVREFPVYHDGQIEEDR
ncbi:hypothetical protein [Catenisphaera adipataccumulans]|jgi:uncharacterized protein YoxC|uniref:Uncharacterized protein YoxC n=1 Tax=Catenisphaera adipataccumulans TaxID=700500 RepID=A0A7W8FXP6_9FIRM|nr:hypothetical protein [Catenisphaera adipataccumulans]MBB5183187.1 uncharacterized protein YoxC [Catenisphaera adipataccumulans]